MMNKRGNFLLLVELLLVLLVVSILAHFAINFYFKKSLFGRDARKALPAEGLPVSSNPNALIHNVKSQVDTVNAHLLEYEKGLQEAGAQYPEGGNALRKTGDTKTNNH